MEDHPRWQRALLLFEQSRVEQAESELRQLLAEAPNHSRGHSLLARCLAHRERFEEATGAAMQAIHLSPDDAFAFQSLAMVMLRRNRLSEAQQAVREAIGLAPNWSANFALLGQIHFAERRWREALFAAEQGLSVDPQDAQCANLKALALVQLGQKEHAQVVIGAALAQHPENAQTHASQGWALLSQGQAEPALGHFREALRIDPTYDVARQGVVEALKARYFLYRVVLGYFLWMSRLGVGAQWGVIVGGLLAFRVLRSIAAANPALAPWLLPLLIAYVAFVVMTWISVPLANLLLRLNRDGRLALSREQIVTSNWVGACLAGAILFLIAALVLRETNLLFAALVCGLIIPPLSRIYNCERGWPRNAMTAITLVVASLGAAIVLIFVAQLALPLAEATRQQLANVSGTLTVVFLIAALGSQFAANALIAASVKR